MGVNENLNTLSWEKSVFILEKLKTKFDHISYIQSTMYTVKGKE